MKLQPYLSFSGQCEEAFDFYKSVFGGDFLGIMRWGDQKECAEMDIDKNWVMHIALPIGDNILMGDDSDGVMGNKIVTGNNVSITIEPDSRDEAARLFNALSEGGKVVMEMQETFWNAYFGSTKDKFGINWLINYDLKKG